MDGHHLTTAGMGGRDALAYWQDVICRTFVELDCQSGSSSSFRGEVVSRSLGELTLSTMASNQIALNRTRSRISAARDEHCLIVVQLRGQTRAEQDGRSFILETGDFALFDSARPYSAELAEGFQHLVLKLPRETLRRRIGALELVTARRIPGQAGLGRIVSSYLAGMQAELAALDASARARLAETSIELVAAALADVVPPIRAASSTARVALLARAKAFIAANIQRENLGPGGIAAAVGVSERYLRQLFAEDGLSLTRYVWSCRLERCKAALSDRAQAHRAISDIAFGWGFNDMSHFSRYFREHAGLSPKEFREAALGRPTT